LRQTFERNGKEGIRSEATEGRKEGKDGIRSEATEGRKERKEGR